LGIIRSPLFPDLNATAGYEHARGSKNISLPFGGSGGGSSGATPGRASPQLQSSGSSAGGAPPAGLQSPLGLGGLPGVETDVYQVGLDSSWELDLFGGTRRGIEAANADIQAAIEDRRGVMISIVGEIARTYVELRGYQREADIARDNVATQQQTLAIIQDKRRAGLVTDLDVSRQTAQLATTQSRLPSLEAQVSNSIHALGILLSDDPMSLSGELAPKAPLPPIPVDVPVGLPSQLLRRRPDIRAAERQLAAATARVGIATADLYPQFSITGQFGLDSSQAKNLLQWDSRYFLISPGISWPIFDAGRIRSNIAVQNELVRQAQLSYRQMVLKALGEVEDAIANYRQEQVRHQFLADAVKASEDSVTLARNQYVQGVTDFLAVLDAQRSLFDAQDALAQSDQTIAADLVTLYKSLGGGWEIEVAAE
jgi:NodT family efflux transporter outer membrane factor (OMF) lipoprotein